MAAETLGEVGINVVPVVERGAFQAELDRQTSGLTFKAPVMKGTTGLGGVSKEVSGIRAELATLGRGTETKKVSDALKGMGKEAAIARSGVGGLAGELGGVHPAAAAAVVGVAILAKGLHSSADAFRAAVAQGRQFQRIAGGTLDDASALAQAFEDVGVSSEAGAKAMATLARNVDSKSFAKAGIEVARLKDGTVDLSKTLVNVSKQYQAAGDAAKRANILQASFGKGGNDVAKLLERGPKGIESLVEGNRFGLKESDVAKLNAYKDALADVKQELDKVQVSTGGFFTTFETGGLVLAKKAIAPINETKGALAGLGVLLAGNPITAPLIPAGLIIRKFGQDAEKLAAAEAPAKQVAAALSLVQQTVDGMQPQTAVQTFQAIKDAAGQSEEATAAAQQALAKFVQGIQTAQAALPGLKSALKDANTGEVDAKRAYDDAKTAAARAAERADLKKQSDAITDRIRQRNKNRGIEQADQAVLDSGVALREAQKGVTTAIRNVGAAKRALEDARTAAERAPEQTTRAIENLNRAKIAQSRLGEQELRQLSAVTDAKLRERRAFEDQTTAVRDATRALNGYGSASREARDAADSLRETQRSAIETQLDLADSADRIQEEQKRLATTTDPAEKARIQRSIQRAQLQQQRIQDAAARLPEKVADAQRNLNAATTGVAGLGDEKSVDAARAANRTIEDSQTSVRDAVRNSQDAEQALSDFRRTAYVDAANGVKDASTAVADALKAEKDASQNVKDAQNNVKDALDGVAKAYNGVEAAQRAQRYAIEDAKTARDAYKLEVLAEEGRAIDLKDSNDQLAKTYAVTLPKALEAWTKAREAAALKEADLLIGEAAASGNPLSIDQQAELRRQRLNAKGLTDQAKDYKVQSAGQVVGDLKIASDARSEGEARSLADAGQAALRDNLSKNASFSQKLAQATEKSLYGATLNWASTVSRAAPTEIPVELKISKDQKDFAELLFGSQLAAKVVSTGTNTNTPPSGTIPNRRASGGRAYGDTLVGEHGPELVRFNRPGHVYTAAETHAMMNRSNPASNVDNSRVVHVGQIVTPAARTETASRALLTQLVRGF
jgi:hypothetical protein